MIDIIKNIAKIIQVICLFIVPIITLYWLLIQANLPSLEGILSVFGMILDPLINFVGAIYSYSVVYEGKTIDLTALIAVLAFLACFGILHYVIIIIETTQKKIAELAEFKRQKHEEAVQKELHNKYLNTIKNKKYFQLIVEITKTQSSLSYLLDDVSGEDLGYHIKNLIDHAKNFHGQLVKKESIDEKDIFILSFSNQEEVINFALSFDKNIKNINSKISHTAQSFSCKIVMDCPEVETIGNKELMTLQKMINSVAAKQILCTAFFYQRYNNFGEDKKIHFNTRGLYSILNEKHELYEVTKVL